MQAISYMRRDSTYQNFVKASLFQIFLLIYNILSSIYLFLPPLFGVLFLYFVLLLRKERYYSLYSFVAVMCIFEISKGFYPGILFVTYSLVYIFLFPNIVKIFDNFNAFDIFYTPIIYILYFILNFFILLFYNYNVDIWSPMIIYYIFVESIIALVVRWIFDIK